MTKSLEERAKAVGIDFAEGPEEEIASREKRVFEAENARRANQLWIVALVSGIASVVSAIAAAISAWKTEVTRPSSHPSSSCNAPLYAIRSNR